MSNQILVTPLFDGANKLIVQVYVESDGASGDETNYVIIDPADYEVGSGFLTVESIQSSLVGFTALLKFGHLVNGTPVWVVPEDSASFDFRSYAGLYDRSPTADGDGKVLMTTDSLDGTDKGTFVIVLRK